MQFKVLAVSQNTNSFGLRQMILIARDGTAYSVCASYLNCKKKDDIVEVQIGNFARSGFEIPRQLAKAPQKVIDAVWGKITLAQAKKELRDINITIRKKDGEYRVNFRGGKEETAYYTNCLHDALETGKKMVEA